MDSPPLFGLKGGIDMTHGIKENITYGSALVMLVFGVVLTTAGFLTAPVGEIHDSVLYVLGQCLLFAGSIMGVGTYTAGKVREMRHDIDRRFRAYERGADDGKRPHNIEDNEEEPINEEDDESER
jgi:hypothetical protein